MAMYLVGFPLLVIPFAVYNIIEFIMPGATPDAFWANVVARIPCQWNPRDDICPERIGSCAGHDEFDDVVDGERDDQQRKTNQVHGHPPVPPIRLKPDREAS